MLIPARALLAVACLESAARLLRRPRRHRLEVRAQRSDRWLPWRTYASIRAAWITGRNLQLHSGFYDWRVRGEGSQC